MANKPLVLCDVDGVLADFVGHVERTYDELGLGLEPDRSLRLERRMCPEGLGQYHNIVCTSEFHDSLPLLPGASELMAQLFRTNYLILTAPMMGHVRVQSDWVAQRLRWLIRHGVPANNIVFARPWAKEKISGDILIEDCYDTSSSWGWNRWKRGDHYVGGWLIDQPWNRYENFETIGVQRLGNTMEAAVKLKEILDEQV